MIRLALRVRRADSEIALAHLLDLAPTGVEERDLGDVVEYAVYGAPGELPALPDLRATAGDAFVDVSTQEVADDWHERWRAFHRPVDVGDGALRVRAPWHPPAKPGRLEVVIDPGQAFGTGAHPTTRLCLELLTELDPGGPLVDLGCGSGVLAIAARRLGWAPVLALDHDDEAVAATRANAAANDAPLEVRRHDLLRDGPPPAAPTVLGNLLRPLLLALARGGFADATMPATLIVSGLLCHEADEVGAVFARRGLLERARRADGEWAALSLGRRISG